MVKQYLIIVIGFAVLFSLVMISLQLFSKGITKSNQISKEIMRGDIIEELRKHQSL